MGKRLKNAGLFFQSLMDSMLWDILCLFVTSYLDDLTLGTESEKKHIEAFAKLLQRLQEKKEKYNMRKCLFRVREVELLSNTIS